MKKILKIAAAVSAALLMAGLVRFMYMRAVYPEPMSPEKRAEMLAQPVLRAENYGFDPASPLENRIGPPPIFLLNWLRTLDQRPGYKGYTPTPSQRRMLAGWFDLMPGPMRAVLRERLIGVYLVDGFLGNGLSNMVLGHDGSRYAWVVLNTSGFSSTLSETFTGREASAFRGGGVSVDCGGVNEPPGVFYTFFHEMTHAYDYVQGITPYVEREWEELLRGFPPEKKRRWDVWAAYETPLKEHDSPLRGRISFYGIGGGPLLDGSEAPAIYAWLEKSPFTSLYGAQNWAEDAVELMVYNAVTDKLGRPCVIKYGAGGKFTPGPAAAARAEALYNRLSR